MKKLLLLLQVVLLAGCSTPQAIVKALAKDPATVHLEVYAAGVTIKLDRTAPGTNTPPHSVKDGQITVTKP